MLAYFLHKFSFLLEHTKPLQLQCWVLRIQLPNVCMLERALWVWLFFTSELVSSC